MNAEVWGRKQPLSVTEWDRAAWAEVSTLAGGRGTETGRETKRTCRKLFSRTTKKVRNRAAQNALGSGLCSWGGVKRQVWGCLGWGTQKPSPKNKDGQRVGGFDWKVARHQGKGGVKANILSAPRELGPLKWRREGGQVSSLVRA